MAEPDGNPTDPNDPHHRQPAQVKPVAPAPRVNPPNINNPKGDAAPGGPPGFGDFLEWMRDQMTGDAATAESQRTLIPKEKKKFQRRDAESRDDLAPADLDAPVAPVKPSPAAQLPATPPATPVVPSATASETARNFSPTPAGDASEPLAPRVRRGQQAATKRNPWISVFIQIGVLALIGGSFLLGRASVRRTAPAPTAAPAAPEVVKDGKATTKLLSDANAALIDQAMNAEQSSDFKKARELLEKVRASGEHVNGIVFQLAQLAVFANESTRAVQLLNDALNEGEALSDAYNLRATLGARINVMRTSEFSDYETATKIDPFNARNFFYWGAALRRSGKFQAALVRLQEALDRLREPTAEGLYRLTMRLTQVELGREREFADEMAKQMALPSPGIDWLFTAAALELRDGKPAAAAAHLAQAEQLGDPDAFSLRLRDYYFYQHRFDKEIKPFFDRLNPAKPGGEPAPPAPAESPSAAAESAPPDVGLNVPTLPPPASPGATVAR